MSQMSPAASSAYVAELRQQIAILSERCALLAAELAAAAAEPAEFRSDLRREDRDDHLRDAAPGRSGDRPVPAIFGP
mgnify:CR=1 FL=1